MTFGYVLDDPDDELDDEDDDFDEEDDDEDDEEDGDDDDEEEETWQVSSSAHFPKGQSVLDFPLQTA
jgi:hypothetical protein